MKKPIGLQHIDKYNFSELYEERAAIKQFDGETTKVDAEAEAFEEVFEEFRAKYKVVDRSVLKDGIEWFGSFMAK